MRSKRQTVHYDDKLAVVYSDTREKRVLNLAEAGLPEVPVLAASRTDRYVAPCGSHRHTDCFEIGLCLRGALTLLNRDEEHHILPGNIFLNKPNDSHCLTAHPRGTKIYWALIRDPQKSRRFLNLAPAAAHDLHQRLNRIPCHVTANSAAVKQAFASLFKHYDAQPGAYRTFCLSTACANLLTAVIDAASHQNAPVHAKRMKQIIADLREHPERKLSLGELVREARLSSTLFIDQFKQMTGLPPSLFVIACRLDAAKRLLASTDTPLARIALDLGFCAPQHLSTHFKRATGMTPRAWRNQHRR